MLQAKLQLALFAAHQIVKNKSNASGIEWNLIPILALNKEGSPCLSTGFVLEQLLSIGPRTLLKGRMCRSMNPSWRKKCLPSWLIQLNSNLQCIHHRHYGVMHLVFHRCWWWTTCLHKKSHHWTPPPKYPICKCSFLGEATSFGQAICGFVFRHFMLAASSFKPNMDPQIHRWLQNSWM